ncbi:MAG: UDP-glucose--hexose-1-phosphate uridylyltransferase, partial [Saprospiraceae bacterium]
MIDFSNDPHKRYNILTGEWVLVSPHRTKRPWQGKVEQTPVDNRPSYDEKCYLCPGNIRAGGKINPNYKDTFVFTNDFAALNNEGSNADFNEGLLQAKGEKGICRVLCFSPDHSKTIPEMSVVQLEKVVDLWVEQFKELGGNDFINYVQIFENKGAMMGCSNPHPHGQIWSQSSVPLEVEKKTKNQKSYFEKNNRGLLSDYLNQELNAKERIIVENNSFVALVPFWAIWPYETMIIPRRKMAHISEMTQAERTDYADILQKLTIRMDNVFSCSFPYSAGIHQAPTDSAAYPEWHWHHSFYPPLLRSATVKKFMVGYEMFASPQRDIT